MLSKREMASYGLGAVGKDMVYMFSASYILYYYQDILGVSAIAMGMILMAARVFDARKQLEVVGLSEKMYSYAGKLSGGQKQRVAIARALMQKPDIILADEPVASLDPYSAEQITDILVQLNRQYNITVIMNSHSVELALKKSDRIIGIADGRLVLDKKSPEVTNEDVEFIYGGEIGRAHV